MLDTMNDFLADFYDEAESPVDAYEAFLLTTETIYSRSAWDRVVLDQLGRFAGYKLEFLYLPDDGHIVARCWGDLMLDPEYEALAAPLILKINRGLAMGHFDMAPTGHPVLKHSLCVAGLDEKSVVARLEEFRTRAVALFDQSYAALSVMQNHMKRLAEAGFVLEMDDFLPAVNDNAGHLSFALMDVKGEG